jgi:hypothetical protein
MPMPDCLSTSFIPSLLYSQLSRYEYRSKASFIRSTYCLTHTVHSIPLLLSAVQVRKIFHNSVLGTSRPGCRDDVSLTDVSPNENSWILCSLHYLFLGLMIADQCVPTLDLLKELVVISQFGLWPTKTNLPEPWGRVLG